MNPASKDPTEEEVYQLSKDLEMTKGPLFNEPKKKENY